MEFVFKNESETLLHPAMLTVNIKHSQEMLWKGYNVQKLDTDSHLDSVIWHFHSWSSMALIKLQQKE